jgi:rubredoxin
MKCPNCKYEYDYSQYDVTEDEDGKPIHEHGTFFTLPINLERTSYAMFSSPEREEVYGCPSCGNVFLDIG